MSSAAQLPVVPGYHLTKVLGKGAFGKVFLATTTGGHPQNVAIKQVRKSKVNDMQTLREIITMRKLMAHENVIKLLDAREDPNHYYMVLELAPNGELFDYIGSGIPEEVALFYFRQLVGAMEYMHGQNVAHRDLKLENLLLDSHYNLKVCDFGFSKLLAPAEGNPGLMYTMCGSPAYVAPEILLGQGYDGKTADIWSCGVILCAMISACLPVEDRAWDGDAFFDKLKRHDYSYEPWGRQLAGQAEDLCKHMLEADPRARWSWAQIRQHPWFKGATLRVSPVSEPALFMADQKRQLALLHAVPATGADAGDAVYRAVDLGATGSYEEADGREGIDVDEMVKRREAQAQIQLLSEFDGEHEATTFGAPAGMTPADFARRVADLLAKDQQFVLKATGDEYVIKAKKMTPRGKLSLLIQVVNRHGGMVAQCQRLAGDQFLFQRTFKSIADAVRAPAVSATVA